MPKLPVLTSKQLIRVLEKHGFCKKRQKGSHVIMVNEEKGKQVVVPMHGKTLKRGTVAGILRIAGINLR